MAIIAGTREWLEARMKAINSTESSALFGLSPYVTAFELWHQKHDGIVVEIQDDNRKKWGRRFEAPIAEGMAEDLGLKAKPFKEYLTHPKEPRMGSSFDYMIWDKQGRKGLMEIKNVDYFIYKQSWSEDEATPYIEVQVQHQMEVADLDFCLIAVMVGNNDPKVIWRKRDRTMGARIRQRIKEFWASIEANNPPEPVFEEDADFVISLHQSAGVNILQADEGLIKDIREYKFLSDEISILDKQRKVLKAQILDTVGDEYNKVIAEGLSLSLGMTKDTPPTVITEDMVGQTYGGRKGYRQFRLTMKEARHDKENQ